MLPRTNAIRRMGLNIASKSSEASREAPAVAMPAAKAKSARGVGERVAGAQNAIAMGGDSVHERHPRLPKTKRGFCVSTVSIVCSRDGGLPDRARADQIVAIFVVADVIGRLRLF
jgi:hypothetical protein